MTFGKEESWNPMAPQAVTLDRNNTSEQWETFGANSGGVSVKRLASLTHDPIGPETDDENRARTCAEIAPHPARPSAVESRRGRNCEFNARMSNSRKCAEIAHLSPRPADVKLAKGTHLELQNRTVSLQTTLWPALKWKPRVRWR